MTQARRGKLVVVSGPSGVGKTTVLRELFARCEFPLKASVSATTRPPRPDEVDGVHYHFLSPEEFCRRRRRGEFLECADVFGQGVWYGTLDSEVAPSLEEGKWVVLSIDIQGTRSVVARYPDAITIFIRPSSPEVLRERLDRRATESEASLQRRLEQAKQELAAAGEYRFQVVNDDVRQAVDEICKILKECEEGGD